MRISLESGDKITVWHIVNENKKHKPELNFEIYTPRFNAPISGKINMTQESFCDKVLGLDKERSEIFCKNIMECCGFEASTNPNYVIPERTTRDYSGNIFFHYKSDVYVDEDGKTFYVNYKRYSVGG